jgi:uncharacterized protein
MKRHKDSPLARRVGLYLAGCLLFSLGVKLFLNAELGLAPLHSMTIGLAEAIGLPFVGLGLVASTVSATLLVVWTAWSHRLPPLTTFLTMALVGYLIDLWNVIGLDRWTAMFLGPILMMLGGLLLESCASALIS